MRYTKFQKIFGVLLAAVLLICTLPLCGFAETEEKELQFHNGKFKILILSDVQDTDTPQKETTALVEAALDSTNPDLVVLLGGRKRHDRGRGKAVFAVLLPKI